MAKLQPHEIEQEPRHLGVGAGRVSTISGLVGLVALAASIVIGLVMGDLARFCFAYLTSFCFFLSISLGALFFVTIQHLARAGWSVVVRRLAEIAAANLPLMAILVLPVALSVTVLYEWTNPTETEHAELLLFKKPYLNVPFFLLRLAVYFAVWSLLARTFLNRSVAQDASADPDLTLRLTRFSGLAIVLFGATVTFASFDLLMSLTPGWFSSIYGVYYFTGCVLAFLCVVILATVGLQAGGLLRRAVTREHYHDLGKLLFGFVFFWGYIAFSQYMLIWYANMPEETQYYLVRQQGPWKWVSLGLLFGHFFVPFLGLLPQRVKRRKPTLVFWAAWVLVLHWVDVFWLVMPTYSPKGLPLGPLEIGCFLGIGGIYVAGLVRIASRCSLVPTADPRLGESLAFENA